MCVDHPVAGDLARVGAGQHEVVVDAEDEPLERTAATASAATPASRRARAGVASATTPQAASRHEDRVDRQHPAGEEARLLAEVEEQQDRRGQRGAARAGGRRDEQRRRRRRARPATAASRAPQVNVAEVVAPAARVGQAELAALVAGGLGLLACRPLRGTPWWSSSAYGLTTRKPRARSAPTASTRLRTRACATGDANAAAITRHDARSRPCTWSRSPRPSATPGQHVLARAAGAVDARRRRPAHSASGASVGASLSAKWL